MVHCYRHVIESTECVRRLVGVSSDTLFQLNERQCQILAQELVDTNIFLGKKSTCSKFDVGVEYIILQNLCSAVKRAEVLVKKCCCKDLESWLVSAMMLVEIQEEFMAIILDIHLWRMLLDFAITCGRGLSQEKKVEEMKIMDEEYHQLLKDLRRESHALRQAVVEDKETIISRTTRIVNLHGSKSGLDYLRAIYLQSWLTNSVVCRDMDLTKYEFVNVLGHGGSGAVLKVKWLGVECALKALCGQDEKEATALKGLFHPNIVRLFHYWEDCPENPQSRLLMELMPQDLGAYMEGLVKSMSSSKMQMGKDGMPFSLPVAIDIMYQIAEAMRYMHEKHMTHRDLKPANILVKERPRVGLTCIDGVGYLDIKLADFGLVKSYTNTSTFQAHSRNKGTGMYRAPEIFGKDMAQKRHYMPMADVWSFGIICAEILSGRQAYAEHDNYGFAIQTMISKEGLRPTLPKHCPPYLAFCIKSCWEYYPSRRPSFASLCKLLRHAKLLSLGVTELDDSKGFFAYTTRSDQVQTLNLSPSSSRARVSTFSEADYEAEEEVALTPTGNLAKICDTKEEKEEAVTSSGNPQKNHSRQKNKKPGRLLSYIQDWLEGKSVESELPKFRKAARASIILPKPSPATDLEGLNDDSPRSSFGNNCSREEDSCQIRSNPTQMVKSLRDPQEPAQLTRASSGNAISPLDASDPIQPAIIPRQKLMRVMLVTKAGVRKFATDCEAEEEVAVTPSGNVAKICETKEEKEEAVNSSGNPQKNHSRQKNKKPGRLLSHIQDWFEGKSVELELPKFRKATSASIIVPKSSPATDLEGLKDDSPRSLIRNNGSREAIGYQFRAPPPGSYQDDDTEPSPKNLLMAVMGVKSAVNHFAKVLITHMNRHPVELEYLKQTILPEVRADVDRANHWKFLVQAFICKRLFDGFNAPNGYFGVEYFEDDQMTKLIAFADFSKFKDKASTISMLLDSDSPDDSFLGRFCFKKFKSISGDLASNQPLPIYKEEWSAVERECHPKTVFYQSFLKVAVSVWLVHRLVHSFEEKVEMLIYEKGDKFQRQTMESVVPGSYEEEDEEADVNTEVGFSVIPGFQVSRSVVKCEVYLRSRNRHTDLEITGRTSTEKTPVKAPTNKSPGRTLSSKTSVKPHTPELPVRDSHSLESLQPPEDFSNSSHYVDHYLPTMVGDDGSSSLAVWEARRFWDAHPANQRSVNGSGRKNKYAQDNVSGTFAGSDGDGTTIYKMAAASSRSSNHRAPHYAVRDTKVSEMRRLPSV